MKNGSNTSSCGTTPEQAARLRGSRLTTSWPITAERAGVGRARPARIRNQRGLAGAVGAEQAEELALGDLQRNAGERLQAAETLDDLLNGNGEPMAL